MVNDNWISVADLDVAAYHPRFAQQVIRSVHLNCPGINTPLRVDGVQVARLGNSNEYVLVKIDLDGESGGVLFGLQHVVPQFNGTLCADHHFHPFPSEQDAGIERLLVYLVGPDGMDHLLSFLASLRVVIAAGEEKLCTVDLKRKRVYLPAEYWEPLRTDDENDRLIIDAIEPPQEGITRIGYWITRLPCYRSFALLELLELSGTGSKASYILVDRSHTEVKFTVLESGMEDYGQLNTDTGQLSLDASVLFLYLRFFFFLKKGRHGRFFLAHDRHSLMILSVPEQHMQQLSELDVSMRLLADNEVTEKAQEDFPGRMHVRLSMIFKDSIFGAHCAVLAQDGLLTLYSETLDVEGLETSVDEMGSEHLALLQKDQLKIYRREEARPVKELQGSPAYHFMNEMPAWTYHTEAQGSRAKEALTAEQFMAQLQACGSVQNVVVSGPVILGKHGLGPLFDTDRMIQVRQCEFLDPFILRDVPPCAGLVFSRCEFQQGLSASGCALACEVSFLDCFFGKDREVAGAPELGISIDVRNTLVDGTLLLWNCQLRGRFLASGVETKGDLLLQGCDLLDMVKTEPFHPSILASEPADGGLKYAELWDRNVIEIGKKIFPTFFGTARIDLANARIQGNLEIGAAMATPAPMPSTLELMQHISYIDSTLSICGGHLSMNHAQVQGSISFVGFLCLGDMVLDDMFVGGSLRMYHLSGGAMCSVRSGAFLLTNSTVKGIFDAFCFHGCPVKDATAFMVSNSQLGSAFRLSCSKLRGHLIVNSAIVVGEMNLSYATVEGDIDLRSCTLSKGVWATRDVLSAPTWRTLVVKGDLDLSGATIGTLRMESAQIHGRLHAYTGSFGIVKFDLGYAPTDGQKEMLVPEPCRVAAIKFHCVTVKVELYLRGIQVELAMMEEMLRGEVKEKQQGKGISITDCTIEGNVSFFVHQDLVRPEYQRQAKGEWEKKWNAFSGQELRDYGARTWGTLDLSSNVIKGELDVRNVEVEEDLLLNDCEIAGDLLLAADYTFYGQFGLTDHEERQFDGLRTRAKNVTGEKLICQGDLKLTGLHVDGSVDLIGAQVTGNIELVRIEPLHIKHSTGQRDSLEKARIGHRLDLTSVRANYLKIDGENFGLRVRLKSSHRRTRSWLQIKRTCRSIWRLPMWMVKYVRYYSTLLVWNIQSWWSMDSKGHRALRMRAVMGKARIRLERSKFSRLEIGTPTPWLDLSKIEVDRWIFGDENSHSAKAFMRILDRMQPFERGTWIEVEKALRNQALTQDADRIFRGMRRKARGEMGPWRLFWDVLRDITAGYGTEVLRPLAIWVMLFVSACVVFSDPDNIEFQYGEELLVHAESKLPVHSTGPVAPVVKPQVVDTAKSLTAGPVAPNAKPLAENAPRYELREFTRSEISDDDAWGTRDGVVIALRYMVPLISLPFHEEWNPSDDAQIKNRWNVHVDVEWFAILCTILSYILLSIAVLGVTSTIVRGKQ